MTQATCTEIIVRNNLWGKNQYQMGSEKNIGKYRLGRTIGEGTFSKVKLGLNGNTGEKVAIKIIDKQMVMENNLKHQANQPHLLSFLFLFSK